MNAEYHQNTMRWLSAIYGVLSTSLFLIVISGYASGLARRSVKMIIYFSLGMIAARFVYLAIDPGPMGWDYDVFRVAGRHAIEGESPYTTDPVVWSPLNPPTALPIMEIFASMPRRLGVTLWMAVNFIASLLLVPVAWAAIKAVSSDSEQADLTKVVTKADLWLLAVAFSLASNSFMTLFAGQFSLVTAVLLPLSIVLQRRGNPALAGICLALATVKVGTLLPFLLLFCSFRRDRLSWLAFAVTVIILLAAGTPLEKLVDWTRLWIKAILYHGSEGHINDYSFQGPYSPGVIGLEHLLCRAGMKDRNAIMLIQLAILFAIGCVIYISIFYRRLKGSTSLALIGCYSSIFLYHRLYDTVILVLPLLYLIAVARLSTRVWTLISLSCACGIAVVLNIPSKVLEVLTVKLSMNDGITEALGRAILLPYVTWIVLISLIAIYFLDRTDKRLELARQNFSKESP